MVGKVCEEYATYKQKDVIGHGGFGLVYKLDDKHAVKEEKRYINVTRNVKIVIFS